MIDSIGQPAKAGRVETPEPSRLPFGSTVYQRLHERLRNEILSGVLAPGSRLKIAEIANRHGLSQMPVREALQQLQGEGLVVLLPNRGATVRRMDARFLGQIFAIREALECMLTAEAALLIDAPTLAELRLMQRQFDQAAARDDHQLASALNRDFHRIILAVPGNDEALKLIDVHSGLIKAFRSRFGYGQGRLATVSADHHALIEALSARDAEAARTLSALHLREARDDLVAALEAQEDAARLAV